MNLIYLAFLSGLIDIIFIPKSEARLHAESIVGGTTSLVGQNTYAVSIQHSGRHFCVGAILTNRHIITAAHGFIDYETHRFDNVNYIVVAGVRQAQNRAEPHRVEREVARIYIPREFNPVGYKVADIAVLELTSALGLNQFITHVVLPPIAGPHPTYANQRAVVCGYGDTWVAFRRDPHTHEVEEISSGSYFHELRCGQVDILSNNVCQHLTHFMLESYLCGHMRQRSPTAHEGLCKGDSGAPLVMDNTIIGVVSGSPEGCSEHIEPALYTRITSFLPFIINAINGVHAANMRLARYEVGRHNTRVLVEQ